MSEQDKPALARKAVDQIRDALATLSFASDGHFEDEAQVALDALNWLEDELGLNLLDRPTRSEQSLEGAAVNGLTPVGQEAGSRDG